MAPRRTSNSTRRDPGAVAAAAACHVAGAIHRAVTFLLYGFAAGVGRLIGPLPWSLRLGVLVGGLVALSATLGPLTTGFLLPVEDMPRAAVNVLRDAGVTHRLDLLRRAGYVAACVLAACGAAGLFPRRWGLWALHLGAVAFAALWVGAFTLVTNVPSLLHAELAADFDEQQRNAWLVRAWLTLLSPVAWWLLFVLTLRYTPVWRFYRLAPRAENAAPGEGHRAPDRARRLVGRLGARRVAPIGDRVFAGFRTGGRDPEFRKSTCWAIALHLLVFLGPLLFRGGAWLMSPYDIPKGSGKEVVEVVQVRRVKPKPEREYVLNLDSPIIYHVPRLDESDVFKEVTERTEMQYETDRSTGGKIGKGGGDAGGWPDGVADAAVRFVRLKYGGGDWDQDMGHGSDYNLLLYLRDLTGFRIAEDTEAVTAGQLARFPEGKAPPFVYMTGQGQIHLSGREVRLLRDYCLEEGGMLFADNGGGRFDRSFRGIVRRLFPDKPLVDIADDDPIFRHPFLFPNGAPPLWHHSGRRALGVRHQGRWVVFYHPGDIG
ncbi:MAG: DUF4159 domain-containing protein, partial [Planctomycetota bacterium]